MVVTEIKVLISGIVLLVSPAAYVQSGSTDVNAAIAMEAREPGPSKYGIDIPSHDAVLTIAYPAVNVDAVKGDKDRLEHVDDVMQVALRGDLVQLGRIEANGDLCVPLDSDNAAHPSSNSSMSEVVHLNTLLDEPKMLGAAAHPTVTRGKLNYTGVSGTVVAGWLEMTAGTLRAVRGAGDYREEFRPKRVEATYVETVIWHLLPRVANCVQVTPFSASADHLPVMIPLNPGSAEIKFRNAVSDTSSGDVTPGIGYDFELMYQLFDSGDRPAFPPLPYAIVNDSLNFDAQGHAAHMQQKKPLTEKQRQEQIQKMMQVSFTRAGNGVNCGPANLP